MRMSWIPDGETQQQIWWLWVLESESFWKCGFLRCWIVDLESFSSTPWCRLCNVETSIFSLRCRFQYFWSWERWSRYFVPCGLVYTLWTLLILTLNLDFVVLPWIDLNCHCTCHPLMLPCCEWSGGTSNQQTVVVCTAHEGFSNRLRLWAFNTIGIQGGVDCHHNCALWCIWGSLWKLHSFCVYVTIVLYCFVRTRSSCNYIVLHCSAQTWDIVEVSLLFSSFFSIISNFLHLLTERSSCRSECLRGIQPRFV